VNSQELISAASRIGIPDRLVIVGDTAEFAWCVTEAEDGAWEVYWMERGNKGDLERFANENQACTYMLGRLAYTQVLAGMRYGDVGTA
jgi:hypothetical protein